MMSPTFPIFPVPFRKTPPGFQRGLGESVQINMSSWEGDSIPSKPTRGKTKPQSAFVFFPGTSSGVVQQYNRVVGRGRTGQSAQKHNLNSSDELLRGGFLKQRKVLRPGDMECVHLRMSNFYYIALKHLFGFGLPFLCVFSCDIKSKSRKNETIFIVCI